MVSKTRLAPGTETNNSSHTKANVQCRVQYIGEHTKLQQISIKFSDSRVMAVLRSAQSQHNKGNYADWMIRYQNQSEIMAFT